MKAQFIAIALVASLACASSIAVASAAAAGIANNGTARAESLPDSTVPGTPAPASSFSLIGSGSAVISIAPPSRDADFYGATLWASEHQGDATGFYQVSRADQVTWNSVAIHLPLAAWTSVGLRAHPGG